jgi:hypothetical protein
MISYEDRNKNITEKNEKVYRGDIPNEARRLPLPKKASYGIVIDKLKICYEATKHTYLKELKEMQLNGARAICGYTFLRLSNDRFEFYYVVYDEENKGVATVKFGKYANKNESTSYVFLEVYNEVLYQPDILKGLLMLPERIGLNFHNFTAIDLAVDSPFNVSTIIRKMMKDESVDTIINRKVVKERTIVLDGLTCIHSITLNRLKNPTINIKQKKAQKHVYDGVTVQAYNKREEIMNVSDKQYILDYWGNPKHLYRLEVRLHNEDIKQFLSHSLIPPSINILFNPAILKDMFLFHLTAVIRFRSGRRIIDWKDILNMQ